MRVVGLPGGGDEQRVVAARVPPAVGRYHGQTDPTTSRLRHQHALWTTAGVHRVPW